MKFTVIYSDSWMAGSHMHSITRMKHITANLGESAFNAAERNGIEASAVWFIFKGHCENA